MQHPANNQNDAKEAANNAPEGVKPHEIVSASARAIDNAADILLIAMMRDIRHAFEPMTHPAVWQACRQAKIPKEGWNVSDLILELNSTVQDAYTQAKRVRGELEAIARRIKP